MKLFPTTIKYLTLNKLQSFYGTCLIPPSVTYLTLCNQLFNDINQYAIPDTVQKIEFKNLVFENQFVRSYDIPSYISNRLVNGVFYIYSKSKNRTTIPSNTTHLFWLDDQYIDNDGDGINMPPSVHTLVLGQTFNSAILSLPATVTQMIFNGSFITPLKFISFPPALKYLSFAYLDKLIQENELPNGITHLSIGDAPNFDGNSVPQSVHHMQYSFGGNCYTQIPPQVKHLKIDIIARGADKIYLPTTIKSFVTSKYDKIIFRDHNLQPMVKRKLPFSSSVDTTIDLICKKNLLIVPYALGNDVKSITFGHGFNQVLLKGAIPNSVENLVFGNSFNHKLNKSILPTSLLKLVLGSDFDQDLNDNLPSSLTELMLNTESKPSFTSSSQFPLNLKKLALPYYDGVLDIIPTTINHLEFNRNFAHVIFPIELVPPHITTLVLNDGIHIQSYDLIPPSITSITLCESITSGTKIPCTVESVVLPSSFNQPLDTILQTVNDQ
ncbi:hypothetical protein CYY_009481 [Polysphondylium violaceum]|uniref:FNIP repeat-containing protein n=1 Tax=Polysphondylium violaceum TaxID=133409 RepID=A0A8J4PMZ0_9MYCE|nr:hypothetical protein CYY_009481 [Polysphondylium violaceum]